MNSSSHNDNAHQELQEMQQEDELQCPGAYTHTHKDQDVVMW